MAAIIITFAPGWILKFSKGVIWGEAQPCDLVQSMVSMWSVNTLPNASSLTGGLGFISARPAWRTDSRELSNSDAWDVDWHLQNRVIKVCFYFLAPTGTRRVTMSVRPWAFKHCVLFVFRWFSSFKSHLPIYQALTIGPLTLLIDT